MDNSNSMKAMERALEFEREGSKFFAEAAKKAGGPATKSLFNMLAEQELGHMNFLLGLHETLSAEGKWPAEITIDPDLDFKLIFKDELKRIDTTVKVSTAETEALDFAVAMEHKGRKMYLELSEKASNPQEKVLYARLADWEKGHAAYIEDFYKYFEDQGLFTEE